MSEKQGATTYPRSRNLIFACMVLLLAVGSATAQTKPDPLKSGFENPPESARPRV